MNDSTFRKTTNKTASVRGLRSSPFKQEKDYCTITLNGIILTTSATTTTLTTTTTATTTTTTTIATTTTAAHSVHFYSTVSHRRHRVLQDQKNTLKPQK